EAFTTFGRIGVKVWIYRGEVLPDQPRQTNTVDRNDRQGGFRGGRGGGGDRGGRGRGPRPGGAPRPAQADNGPRTTEVTPDADAMVNEAANAPVEGGAPAEGSNE
ncbi:MAG TPA: hypothetical protein VFN49_10140, partial [Candidatus Aquilonibacter sp.]|nr:hypothetical protein [Candidatus Aquilonibacter sp.]